MNELNRGVLTGTRSLHPAALQLFELPYVALLTTAVSEQTQAAVNAGIQSKETERT